MNLTRVIHESLGFVNYVGYESYKSSYQGCPTTLLTPAFVIQRSKATKNLMDSGTYNSEILRLMPQNDVVGQAL